MLPHSKKFKNSGAARRWGFVLTCVVGALGVTWLAFDKIVGKEQVIAKFSPSAPLRSNGVETKEEPTQVASLSVTATSAATPTVTTPTVATPTASGVASAPTSPPDSTPAPVSPAPVSSAPAAPAPAPAPDSLKPVFEQWVRLWQARDVNAYIGLYASERADLKSHLQVRSSRIKKAQFIEVAVSDVSFRQSGPLETTVRFVQVYRSDTHQSRDIKELVWRTDGGQAKIIAERLVN